MNKLFPQIITLSAFNFFNCYPKKPGMEDKPYIFNTLNRFGYRQAVKQISDFDECPLLYQIQECLKKKKLPDSGSFESDRWLMDKLIIVDFDRIFQASFKEEEIEEEKEEEEKKEEEEEKPKNRSVGYQEKVKDLMERGLDIIFSDQHRVHMVPFDKSGNMSRNSRITFVNEILYKSLNERLNLGIDFSKIEVVLSKYYSYRGLYLSSSKRIENTKFEITPETLIVIKDKRMSSSGKYEVLGPPNEKDIKIVTAVPEDDGEDCQTTKWKFQNGIVEEREYVETPFDGTGLISPEYAEFINQELSGADEKVEATSFQIRLPFVKGMLHRVDFREFLREFDPEGMKEDTYEYEDVFGITRDLKKAQILITESMFKALNWIDAYCKEKDIKDRMQFYCEALKKYNHSLYVSGTNLPYGHSEYTHLTYQMINTLDFTEEEFLKLANRHLHLVHDPLAYIKRWDFSEAVDFDEAGIYKQYPAWKKAVILDDDFKYDSFIDAQLSNTKKGLITKIANGKLVVAGQTRYLCRDLMPMLALLLRNPQKISDFYLKGLFMRFYMPVDKADKSVLSKYENLKYNGFAAFFRNPHLSRNEQCLLQPFVPPENEKEYFRTKKMPTYNKFVESCKRYDKYFGHLTGVVMVPRGSTVPLCLGGADFDGDLVSVVYDEYVVEAVKRGCYENWLYRKLPVVKIPGTSAKKVTVPDRVPYEHIRDTFSNSIGLLANSAVSIGQEEYGRDMNNAALQEMEAADEAPACWKCTILTGLEIDAAKNGKHPDLSSIGADGKVPKKASYLAFRDSYEKLRENPSFAFDLMKIDELFDKNGSLYGIKISLKYGKDSEANIKPVKYKKPEHGTKINDLPILFKIAYDDYCDAKESKENNKHFDSPFRPGKDDLKNSDKIKCFKEECKNVLKLYSYYTDVLKKLKKIKAKSSFGETNTTKLVAKIYDEENAVHINESLLPALRDKLVSVIPSKDDIREIFGRINSENWLFQSEERRNHSIENIIGNGFKAEELDEEQRNFLFHFNQYGFKMLWHVLKHVEETWAVSYEEALNSIMKDRAENKAEQKLEKNDFDRLKEDIENIIESFFEGNLTDADNRIFSLCLEKIKRIVKETKKELSSGTVINTLYEICCRNEQKGKFFWETFCWKEIEPMIKKSNVLNMKGE